jgi:recyclin-1
MDKFATLEREPVRLYASNQEIPPATILQALVGSFLAFEFAYTIIVYHLLISDIATYSICSRATRLCVAHESVWGKRWKALAIDNDPLFHNIFELLQRNPSSPDNFSGAFQNLHLSAQPTSSSYSHTNESYKNKYIIIQSPSNPSLASFFHLLKSFFLSWPSKSTSLFFYHKAKLLGLLFHFLSPDVELLRRWESLYFFLRSAMDRFDSNLLSAFDVADGKGDEESMKEATASSWELWNKSSVDWEMGKVWAEKKGDFLSTG